MVTPNVTAALPPTDLTYWKIDECAAYFDRLHIRGWCHVPAQIIDRVEIFYEAAQLVCPLSSFGQPSPDVDNFCGPGAANVRFDEWVSVPADILGNPFILRCWLKNGQCFVGRDTLTNAAYGDPYFQSWENFIAHLAQFSSGAVLEIGSRARSAVTRRHRIPERLEYVGLDVLAGPNVDVVGDAHELSHLFAGKKFVAAFSTSVFEHLAMPWKVALELNRVLVRGGIVYTSTHQTFPMHDEPWDFWRYSQYTWGCLFNAQTGFEIVESVVGEPARIHAARTSEVTRDLHLSPAWLGSASIVRKIDETSLTWPVPMAAVTATVYPAGEMAQAPTPNRA